MKLIRRQREDRGAVGPHPWAGGSPANELNRIRDQINRIFEDPLGWLAPGTSFFEGWEPTVDIYEHKDRITVRAELPGMKKENLNVSLDGDTLTISGERKQEEERRAGDTYRSERFFGRFQRSITLPRPVDEKQIQAKYKDGVLEITLPKAEGARRKDIEVKTS